MKEEIKCPVCKSKSRALYSLDENLIKRNLEQYFDTTISENLDLMPYQIACCPNCTLSFAYPLKEGSNAFYSWITKQKDYYPSDRWEYHRVYKILEKNKSQKQSLLDVGCGSGEFLALLRNIDGVEGIGLDTTYASVEECKKKLVDAYCMDLNEFLSVKSNYRNYFDYVVSFHCLEHIGDPVSFLKSILQTLKSSGSVFISTPYSPMAMELDWFDPLNHPPHHMGRWNAKAYAELGKQLNLSVNFHLPKALSLIKRATRSFVFSLSGMHQQHTKKELFGLVLKNFPRFAKHVFKQLQREKINGKVAADVILVEFKLK